MLVWNVYWENFNRRKIETRNIFEHAGFWEDLKKAKKKFKDDKDGFAEAVRRSLQYYYWSKCEYEVVITGWPQREGVEEKVDIYSQVLLNWPIFIDWLWEHRKEIK